MDRESVRVAADGRGVTTLWLNRPERGNAYDGDLVAALVRAVGDVAADPSVRVVVLRGRGRHFQAGADLDWIRALRGDDEAANLAVSRQTAEAVHGLTMVPKPVIAAVHGGCFGGGTGLVAACDVVLADETARFAISEARWGLVASPIVPQLLSRIGPGRLRRYALTCERFDAHRAREIGLVDEVCPEGGLDAALAPVVDALLHCPPQALAMTKAAVLRHSGLDAGEGTAEPVVREHAMRRLSEEAGEGLASFAEKRAPGWYPV